MSYPSSIPSYTGFTSTHTLQQDGHASQHNLEQSDIAAIATKVGTGVSTPSNNTVLRGNGTGTSGYDTVHAATDISGVLGEGNGGTGLTSVALLLARIYPVGSIYTETTGTNPNTTFGFGTWAAYGAGRVLVGNGTSDQAFAAGATGGESNHTLSSTEMPSHTHIQNPHTHSLNKAAAAGGDGTGQAWSNTTTSNNTADLGATAVNQNTGGGASHNNLQPYIVCYFWQRTA